MKPVTIKLIMLNLVFLSLSLAVIADTVEFEFSGFIDTIYVNENNALGDVYINQPFEGWFSYSSVPDQWPDSVETGCYHQDASISVTLGTQTLSYIDDFVYIWVHNNHYYYNADIFSFGVDGPQGDFDFGSYGVQFYDSTGTVFDNDDLPMSFELAQFDSARLTILGRKIPSSGSFDIGGEITSITLIPEPGTVLLLGFGGLALLRKRRR